MRGMETVLDDLWDGTWGVWRGNAGSGEADGAGMSFGLGMCAAEYRHRESRRREMMFGAVCGVPRGIWSGVL